MKHLTLLAAFVLLAIAARAQQHINYHKTGAPLPPFTIEKWDGTTYNSTQLKAGKPVMVIIFSPDCDHCEHAIDSLMAMKEKLRNTQLVFVSEVIHQPQMKAFVQKSGMAATKQFAQAGVDKSRLIPRIYTNQLLPQINIYNTKQELVKTFAGNFPLDSLRMLVH